MPDAPLKLPVTVLHGVGAERAKQLHRLEVHTVEDLLCYRPRRYEDRSRLCAIADVRLHDAVTVRGRIVAQGVKYWRQRARSVFEFALDDGTGRLHCRWWNQPFMEGHFRVGLELLVFGRVSGLKPRTMDHPETEVLEAGEDSSIHLQRIVPVYPLTEGLPQRWLRSLVWRTIEEFGALMPEPWPEASPKDLPARADAVRWLHFPANLPDAERARRRLAFDEFFELQLGLQRRRRNLNTHARGLPCGGDNRLIRPFLAQLGFRLTEAQTRVLRELRQDLSGPHPMRRLLQGDVGCGKTVVAACCVLMALESGYTTALLAPTEILAEQHWQTFNRWLTPLRVAVELRTGSRRLSNPSAVGPDHASGSPGLHIGTHALIEEGFTPENLGLVIIDEQHKFGVAQREALVRKGAYPHVLVMTATPIPRTLGLTFYGDLDVSVIDQPPPGRGRVRTFVREAAQLPKVLEFIRRKLAEGRQAYVVYPRVEESDLAAGVKAVTEEYERLQKALAPHRVGLLHGRLTAPEKDQVMRAFRASEVQVLLATTVIEVGLDVANATVMLIESAETFGLATLHQLRGRIGRGAHESYCVLVAKARTPEARARLQVMAETNDGFRIAEADLRLRGPGEFLGQQQSGLPRFRFGDLAADLDLIQRARDLADCAARPDVVNLRR